MRQRRKRSRAAGISRGAFCIALSISVALLIFSLSSSFFSVHALFHILVLVLSLEDSREERRSVFWRIADDAPKKDKITCCRHTLFRTLFIFLLVLGTVVVSRSIFSVAAAAATREAPDQRGGIKFTLRKNATSIDQRRRQIKVTDTGSFAAGATEKEAVAAILLPIPPPPPTTPPATTTHVVIASFGGPEPYHAVSLYFASKLAGATVHHVIMHTYGKGHEPGGLNLKVAKEVEGATAGTAEEWKQAHNSHQQPPRGAPSIIACVCTATTSTFP